VRGNNSEGWRAAKSMTQHQEFKRQNVSKK
jgi:hypothetical protein